MVNLSLEQHRRLFNIITLESRIDEIDRIAKFDKEKRALWLRREQLSNQLNKLSNFKHAERLFAEMIEKTEMD